MIDVDPRWYFRELLPQHRPCHTCGEPAEVPRGLRRDPAPESIVCGDCRHSAPLHTPAAVLPLSA